MEFVGNQVTHLVAEIDKQHCFREADESHKHLQREGWGGWCGGGSGCVGVWGGRGGDQKGTEILQEKDQRKAKLRHLSREIEERRQR